MACAAWGSKRRNPSQRLVTDSRTPLFRTRLIRSPRYFADFEGRSNSLGFTLMFSVIYYQLFRTRLFRVPRYFELTVLSLHLKSTPLFRTCQKQSTYIRAQLETYCILFELVLRNWWLNNAWLTCSVPPRNSSCVIQLQQHTVSELFFRLRYSCVNSELLYFSLISVFLHTVLYFI